MAFFRPSFWQRCRDRFDHHPFYYGRDEDERMVAAVLQRAREFVGMKDDRLARYVSWMFTRAQRGEDQEKMLPDAFAVVRDAFHRVRGAYMDGSMIRASLLAARGACVVHEETEAQAAPALASAAALWVIGGRDVDLICRGSAQVRSLHRLLESAMQLLGLRLGMVLPEHQPGQRTAAYASQICCVDADQLLYDHMRAGLAGSQTGPARHGQRLALVVDASLLSTEAANFRILVDPTQLLEEDVAVVAAQTLLHFVQGYGGLCCISEAGCDPRHSNEYFKLAVAPLTAGARTACKLAVDKRRGFGRGLAWAMSIEPVLTTPSPGLDLELLEGEMLPF